MQNLSKLDRPEICSRLFSPPQSYKGNCPTNAEDIVLNICEGVHLTCRFYLAALDAPTLIYFHGGAESSDSFDLEAESYIQVGINVFLTSLRGFGKSTGVPLVSVLLVDAGLQFLQASEWLRGRNCSGAIIVMGRSLGVVCAIDVVNNNQDRIKAMILESAFCDTLPLLTAMGIETFADFSEDQGFNNVLKITEIKVPTMIFHGSRDVLVPISQAEKLQAASGAKNKQFLVIPGAGHDNVWKTGGSLYFKTIKGFVDTVCGINTWRQRRRKFKNDQD